MLLFQTVELLLIGVTPVMSCFADNPPAIFWVGSVSTDKGWFGRLFRYKRENPFFRNRAPLQEGFRAVLTFTFAILNVFPLVCRGPFEI